MGYVKKHNIWVKKVEWRVIYLDEVALGEDEVHVEGDKYEEGRHEIDTTVGASSSVIFNTRSAFEAILGRFESFNTRLDSMEHKQDELIVQVQAFQHQHFQPTHPPSSPSWF